MPNCKEDIINKIVLNNLSNVIHKELFSKYLYKNISISIYLPPNFDPLKEYGLALFTDGDEHLTLLKTDKILDHLILKNKIKPMLGLFIDSNEARMKELMCDQDFENFIIKEALPFIKNNYKLSKNPKDNLISGFSLGGLTAMHLGLKHNTIFGNVLSQSGSFFFKMSEMRKLIYKTSKKPKIYLNFGVLEDKKRVINGNLKIYAILKKHKFKVSLECFYSGHDYLSWSEYLYRGLLELLALH
ncbi:MAG: alpha/beta hydrolase [Sarcina sp.]